MNNLAKKILLFGIIIIALLAVLIVPVYAEGEKETIVFKKSTNEYLVYFEDICNNAFQFAIANDSTIPEASLSFVSSAKDGTEEGALNVAFIDDTNHPQVDDDVYIWVKDSTDTTIIAAQKVDIKDNIIDEDIINLINTTTIANKATDRIKVDTTQTETMSAVVDGVDTTIKTGKIKIEEKENATYYYKLIEANDANTDAGKLYGLADKINNYSGNSYGKLKLAIEFYDLYQKLMPEDAEWIKVNNGEILQPNDSKAGDKCIVYIREMNNNSENITDVKLLECMREEAQGKEEKEEQVTEKVQKTVKLPITYDNPTLIVIFAVLIVAIIILAILRKSQTKNPGKHSK